MVYSVSTVAVVFNFSFSILTVGTSVTFGTSCTVFNDSGGGVTVTVFDGYSVSTVAVVFNVGFSVLTVFNDSGSSFTVTVNDGHCMSTVAIVFNIGLGILTIGTSCSVLPASPLAPVAPSLTMVVVVLPLPSLMVTV